MTPPGWMAGHTPGGVAWALAFGLAGWDVTGHAERKRNERPKARGKWTTHGVRLASSGERCKKYLYADACSRLYT